MLKLDFPAIAPVKLEGKYSDIELTDGSRLHCKEWTIKAKQVELKTMAGQDNQDSSFRGRPISSITPRKRSIARTGWSVLARKRRRDAAVRIL